MGVGGEESVKVGVGCVGEEIGVCVCVSAGGFIGGLIVGLEVALGAKSTVGRGWDGVKVSVTEVC